jgi:ribulose 1,5-bisphosphate synthetase/thiazole synthase
MRSGSTVQPFHHARDGASPLNYDVLILGYGPVGATAVALLARYGLRIAIVEQS